uniref:Uncharacterized protein n=1 Tax=Arundo donax TaxID=35708 RepID=A0A0A9HQQ4_ARUDO
MLIFTQHYNTYGMGNIATTIFSLQQQLWVPVVLLFGPALHLAPLVCLGSPRPRRPCSSCSFSSQVAYSQHSSGLFLPHKSTPIPHRSLYSPSPRGPHLTCLVRDGRRDLAYPIVDCPRSCCRSAR